MGYVSAFAFAALVALGWLFHRAITHKTTVLLDKDHVGEPVNAPKLKGTAYCVGGAIGGLVTARILSEHYEQVVILDDEHDGEEIDDVRSFKRPNVWQYPYIHAVTPLAVQICRKIFPGFLDEVFSRGGRLNHVHKIRLVQFGKEVLCTPDFDLDSVSLTRPGFEATVKHFVREIRNVTFMNAKATDVDVQNGRIVGIHYREHGSTEIKRMDASFVADCSGQSRVGVKWQKRHGFAVPRTSSYFLNLGYSCWSWQLTEEQWRSMPTLDGPEKTSWMFISPAIPNTLVANGAASRCENNYVQVSCSTTNCLIPLPKDTNELIEMYQNTSAPDWFKHDFLPAICKVEPTTIAKQTMPPFSRVHWDEVDMPHNFVAIGDANTRLNPAYGQGMTQCCANVTTLDVDLRNERLKGATAVSAGFGGRAMKRILKRSDASLKTNKALDYSWNLTTPCEGEKLHKDNGGPPALLKILRAYILTSHTDPVVGHAYLKLICNMSTPLALFRPDLLARVLYDQLIRRRVKTV